MLEWAYGGNPDIALRLPVCMLAAGGSAFEIYRVSMYYVG